MAYIEKEKALSICQEYYLHCLEMHDFNGDSIADDIQTDIQNLPAADVVLRSTLEQIKWERDEAFDTLERHGLSLGSNADVVKVRHGYWIDGKCGHYKICSECNQIADFYFDYCPNCGAKMDGKDGE